MQYSNQNIILLSWLRSREAAAFFSFSDYKRDRAMSACGPNWVRRADAVCLV